MFDIEKRGKILIHSNGVLMYWCPGCKSAHSVNDHWTFDGNYEAPTFSPSVLTTGTEERCHCFIRGGKIEFLSDCTHVLAGKTVEMEDPDKMWDSNNWTVENGAITPVVANNEMQLQSE